MLIIGIVFISTLSLISNADKNHTPGSSKLEKSFNVVLKYFDFGPPSVASTLLSVEWYQ